MTELKPCPFCGGEVYLAEENRRDPEMGWPNVYQDELCGEYQEKTNAE